MPALPNKQHEMIAQNIAVKKMSQVDAHQAAGFKRNSGNASDIVRRPEVKARVAELADGVTTVEARRNLVNECNPGEISIEWIIGTLQTLIEESRESGQFKVARDCINDIAALKSLGDNNVPATPPGGVHNNDSIPSPATLNIEVLIKNNQDSSDSTRIFPTGPLKDITPRTKEMVDGSNGDD